MNEDKLEALRRAVRTHLSAAPGPAIIDDASAGAIGRLESQLQLLRNDLDKLPSKSWMVALAISAVTLLALVIVAVVRFIPHAN